MTALTQQFITDALQFLALAGGAWAFYWNIKRKEQQIAANTEQRVKLEQTVASQGHRIDSLEGASSSQAEATQALQLDIRDIKKDTCYTRKAVDALQKKLEESRSG